MVAVHEIGHALGIDHLYRKDSIMYPSYQWMEEKEILPYVDRIQIQNMYGVSSKSTRSTTTRATTKITTRTTAATTKSTTKTTTPKRTTKTTTRSTTTLSRLHLTPCRLFIDAAFEFQDNTFHVLDTGLLRRYLINKRQWDRQLIPFQDVYPRLPNRISGGAYDFATDEVLIFTSTRVYRYKVQLSSGRLIFRRDDTLPAHLWSTIVGAIYYHDGIYLVKATTLQSFDVSEPQKKSKERKLSEEFPGLTGSIKAAFTYGYHHHFFTSDRLVFIWDEQFNRWNTFAKPMETHWFACRKAK